MTENLTLHFKSPDCKLPERQTLEQIKSEKSRSVIKFFLNLFHLQSNLKKKKLKNNFDEETFMSNAPFYYNQGCNKFKIDGCPNMGFSENKKCFPKLVLSR
jgi:hypothetical protein